jgi:uncharacterized membrane protein YqjE
MPAQDPTQPTAEDGRVGRVLHQIAEDVKTIGADEIELAKLEVQRAARTAAIDAAAAMLGGTVALIGLGLLCLVVVVALAPIIPPLWLRLLIMAVIYLVVGGLVAAVFAKRIKRDAVPDLSRPAQQARNTIQDIKAGLQG